LHIPNRFYCRPKASNGCFAPTGQPFSQPRATPWSAGKRTPRFGPTGQPFSLGAPALCNLLVAFALFAALGVAVAAVAQTTTGDKPAAPRVIDKTAKPNEPKNSNESKNSKTPRESIAVPDAKAAGGEPDGIVQVANLVYAGTKSSRCFADHFLIKAEKETAISTSRRFHAVKLADDDLFEFPLVIMTGEGDFQLSDRERENLRRYVERGGFLLASAGCSSTEWDRAFRREIALVFSDQSLEPIDLSHPIFHTVYDITQLSTSHGGTPRPLVGVSIGGRLGVIYSPDGLNDTQHTQGCCCCGGNELSRAIEINVNILAYSLLY
jgi:hypothetical protein